MTEHHIIEMRDDYYAAKRYRERNLQSLQDGVPIQDLDVLDTLRHVVFEILEHRGAYIHLDQLVSEAIQEMQAIMQTGELPGSWGYFDKPEVDPEVADHAERLVRDLYREWGAMKERKAPISSEIEKAVWQLKGVHLVELPQAEIEPLALEILELLPEHCLREAMFTLIVEIQAEQRNRLLMARHKRWGLDGVPIRGTAG